AFRFRGTGFGVGDGSLCGYNSHVLPQSLEAGTQPESLVVVVPSATSAPGAASEQVQVRAAARLAVDVEHDLAVLKISGPPIAALKLRDSERIEEGEAFLFTGFPIGG